MEKCIFIGYPQGYKGWKFYNPLTKKVVISERADFDELYLRGWLAQQSYVLVDSRKGVPPPGALFDP